MDCQLSDRPALACARLRIDAREPFSFALTAAHQTFFRGRTGADYYHDGVYRRVFDRGQDLVLATVRPVEGSATESGAVPDGRGLVSTLEVEVRAARLDAPTLAWTADQVAWVLALDADLSEFRARADSDPLLAFLLKQFPGLRPARTPTVFEALVQAIIGQQISGAVARQIRDLVVDRLGEPFPGDGVTGLSYRAYPRPAAFAAASPDDLRALKLSRRKAEYLREIAGRAAAGELDLESLRALPDHQVVERLAALRGVGRWTAEWVMLRALGRIDAFPADDLALCRILARFYTEGRPITGREATVLAERWGSCRGLVTAYLFAAIRQGIDPGRAEPEPAGPAPGRPAEP